MLEERQGNLFDICANRHGGNENSVAANKAISPLKSESRRKVLDFIASRGQSGATSEEISIGLNLPINKISGRCSELKKFNLVIISGKRLTKSGLYADVLVAREL